MLLADFYKLSHRPSYPANTEKVYSTWTPRTSRLDGINEVVVFGQQMFLKKLTNMFNDNFFSRPKNEVVREYARIVKYSLGVEPETAHIEELHDLGYLPLKVQSLPEGTLAPVRVPTMTIENTLPQFFWLTNYIETLASCELWQPATSATLAFNYRKLLNKYALATTGSTDFVPFQGHDFSMRGMSSLESAELSGLGHLLSFVGTDTIPAIMAAEQYYKADVEKELVGCSVNATEHSIQCAYKSDDEYFKRMVTEVYPTGILSIVSDGRDFWDVVGRLLPEMKDTIMARNGKVVIRPDSGDPVKIVCGDPDGAAELERKGLICSLYETFGGTVNSKGYVELDSHIGAIYGDSITLKRAEAISEQLAQKGFATTNIVYGIGSYTYQYNTRDTFGYALKSTSVTINGDEKMIFKDPKTDDGTKKSQKGRVAVVRDASGVITYKDQLTSKDVVEGNMLETVYLNGKFTKELSFAEIRKNLLTNL